MTVDVDDAVAIKNPLDGQLQYELRRTSGAVMQGLVRALEPIGLRPSEASALVIVGANPGCTQSDLSRATGARPANLVSLIAKLMQAGLLERAPGGGRAIPLILTKEGKATQKQVKQIIARFEAKIARHIANGASEDLVKTLRLISKAVC